MRQGWNYCLRGRDFPPSRRTAKAATPVANAVLSGAAPNIMPVVGGKRGLGKAVFLVEGAHWTMLVLKRLIAFIVASVAVFAAGAALAASGHPEPWQLGMQQGATPVMDDIIWFHNFLV